MRIPRSIAEFLSGVAPRYYGLLHDDLPCAGAKYHSPTPIRVRHVDLGNGKWVPLCGTCRENLEVYQEMKNLTGGEIPWKVRREFGNRLRQVGEAGA